jgi:large subunit ribosomal protein L15
MTDRKRRKSNKQRGERTHGKGDTKNKRGAGNRGGRGRAGSHKHKYSMYYGQFGQEKKQIIGKPKAPTLNVEDLEQYIPTWVQEQKVTKKGKLMIIDGNLIGVTKITGRGKIAIPVSLKNLATSKKAHEKITAAGGNITETDEDFAAADESEDEVNE